MDGGVQKVIMNSRCNANIESQISDIPLSRIQKEILRLILDGLKDNEIALKVFLSKETVKYHKKMIYKKLNVSTMTQAVAKAVMNNII